jgi:hypothetical protein
MTKRFHLKCQRAWDTAFATIIPSWRSLALIGTNPVVRSSYYWLVGVPILAKTITHLEQTTFFRENGLNFSLPFNLQLFYAGAIFFALARAVFDLMCPEVVVGVKNYKDFVDSGRGADHILAGLWRAWMDRSYLRPLLVRDRLLREVLHACSNYHGPLHKDKRRNDDSWFFAIQVRADNLPKAFHYAFTWHSLAHPTARLVTTCLFLLGAAALVGVLIDNGLYVLQQLA